MVVTLLLTNFIYFKQKMYKIKLGVKTINVKLVYLTFEVTYSKSSYWSLLVSDIQRIILLFFL